jgi:hypothetical protein
MSGAFVAGRKLSPLCCSTHLFELQVAVKFLLHFARCNALLTKA